METRLYAPTRVTRSTSLLSLRGDPLQRKRESGSAAGLWDDATGRLLQSAYNFADIPVYHREASCTGSIVQEEPREGLETPGEKRRNDTGLPDRLKASVESLSGLSMEDVKVHHNSSQPRQLDAHAYAWGNDIHIATGQERHLPHEAWHVVQQKQGRVPSTHVLTEGVSTNDDPRLEAEADQMAARALRGSFSDTMWENHLSPSQAVPQNVLQRKKVPDPLGPTDFGQFETTTFTQLENRGVEIILLFHPNEAKVDAKKIALSQSVKTTNASGDAYAIDLSSAKRMVAGGKSGEGYFTDAISSLNNPLYAGKSLSAAEKLKDTPQSENVSAKPTKLKENTRYDLGHCYKEKPTDPAKKKHPAGIYDTPRSKGEKGFGAMFETVALAIEGADKDKYYGSVKWGYLMEGTATAPTVTLKDIEMASKDGMPSSNFMEPAKLWNKGKTRGTLQVIADPEATVGKAGGAKEKLAKGTKLKQVNSIFWGPDLAVEAEVLKADGTGSGTTVYIKQSDIEDMGEGSANKKLPIPAGKPTLQK